MNTSVTASVMIQKPWRTDTSIPYPHRLEPSILSLDGSHMHMEDLFHAITYPDFPVDDLNSEVLSDYIAQYFLSQERYRLIDIVRCVADLTKPVPVLSTNCPLCSQHYTISVPRYLSDRVYYWATYRPGHIQTLLPMFNADDREQLLSGIHKACFQNLANWLQQEAV